MFSSLSLRRFAGTLGLVVLAYPVAHLGRWLLDGLVATTPQWAGAIERFGGWELGMVIGLVVVLPLFRLYGALGGRRRHRDTSP